jgi:GNAT superfamily N-acetyltransferase
MTDAALARLLELGETPSRWTPPDPGEELIQTDAFLLLFGDERRGGHVVVEPMAITPTDVGAALTEVRGLARLRRRTDVTWEVPARHDALRSALVSSGLRPDTPPDAVLMARTAALPGDDADVEVRRVRTRAAFAEHVSVTHHVFDKLDRLGAELARIEREGDADVAGTTFVRYTAYLEGRAVGAATATLTASGAMLHTGSVLPAYRGRGVYRTLVRHRMAEALGRGLPGVVTRAGPMSQPILARMGFSPIGELSFLVDRIFAP